jgi:hypothetical protein
MATDGIDDDRQERNEAIIFGWGENAQNDLSMNDNGVPDDGTRNLR